MRRLLLALGLLAAVLLNAAFAVYVFNYTTEVVEPQGGPFPGATAFDVAADGPFAVGTEAGWILVQPFLSYRGDAAITSLRITDDGLMVAFSDARNRVGLFFTGTGLLLWTRTFDLPVVVERVYVREGPFFQEPTFVLVTYEGGFALLWGPDGHTVWDHQRSAPFVMRSTDPGKILVGQGTRVDFFFLGSPVPYRSLEVAVPVVDLLPDARGNDVLVVGAAEALHYDGIRGEVHWRRPVGREVQAALSWNGGKTYLLSGGTLEIVTAAGGLLSRIGVGEGELVAPTASAYFFLLREDRIDAYYERRPAPVWTSSVDAPGYGVHVNPGGTTLFYWTPGGLYVLDNRNPPVAARAWVGAFGTALLAQAVGGLFLGLRTRFLPSVREAATAALVGGGVGATALLTGSLHGFVELGWEAALGAAVVTASAAALLGRRSGGTLSGMAIGVAVGAVAFLVASVVAVFYRFVLGYLEGYPVVEAVIRSLTLGWALGLAGGVLGGLAAYLFPTLFRPSVSRG